MHRSDWGLCDAVVSRWMTLSVALACGLAGCGGGDSGAGVGPDGKVHQGVGVSGSMTISPTSLTVVQGQSGTATLTLALKGQSPGTITLAGSSLPAGVTATFSPPTLTGSGSSTVTIAAASNAPVLTGLQPFFVGFVGSDTLLLDGAAPSLNITIRNGRPSVTVNKTGTGSGTVTSNPAGINCGNSCSAVFDLGPITLTAVPAAGSVLTSWSGVCIGTALTCTFTPNDFGNIVNATFTSTAAAIVLSASPSPVTIQPGASATTTLTVNRINGFVDPVSVAVSAPTGITVTANPTSISGTTSALTISAAASLAAGSYPVTITATGTGITQQTLAIPVQVGLASNGGTIVFNYATCEANQIPLWFAVQNGTGPWTRVTPTNNAFTFSLGSTGGYAVVTRNGPDTLTNVRYGSAAEIAAIAAANPCGTDPPTGTKQIHGAMANTGTAAQEVFPTIVVGGAQFTKTTDSTASFVLPNTPSGPRDLIAARINSAANASRMIVRRGTNYTNNQNIPIVDFGSGEAFSPPLGVLTPLNLGGDQISVAAALLTSNGSSASYYSSNFLGAAGNTGYQGLPDSLLRAGDLHSVLIAATPSAGTAFRLALLLMHSVNTTTPKQIPFGPRAAGVSVTSLATAPYLRLRGQTSSQAAYTAGAGADFAQGGRTVSIGMTAAYTGTVPATWTLDVPDLSAAGYDSRWALKSGVGASWEVDAFAGDLLAFFGGTAFDNAQLIGAGVRDSSSTFVAAPRVRLLGRPRR